MGLRRWYLNSPTVDSLLLRRTNNFDFIRLMAALSVLVSHSFALTGLVEPSLDAGITLGTLGVFVFFTISGLLIAKSWDAHPRLAAFSGKRFLRIIPAFAAVILFTVLILGPLMSSLPTRTYFQDPHTLRYADGLSVFNIQDGLPGVFTKNPLGSINGSLWTIPFEIIAYGLLAILALTGFLTKQRRIWILVILAGLIGLSLFTRNRIWLENYSLPPFNTDMLAFMRLMPFFFAGMALYAYRERVRIRAELALGLLLLLVVTIPTKGTLLATMLIVPYLVLALAFIDTKYVSRLHHKIGDLSYGIYLFSFPLQQSIVQLSNNTIGPLRLALYSLPVILFFAYLSWHLIEQPSLRRKYLFSKLRYPVMSPETAPLATIQDPSQRTKKLTGVK